MASKVEAGASSCRSSSRFVSISRVIIAMPVMFPPGRLRFVTRPSPIGSAPRLKTMGRVDVAAFVASVAGDRRRWWPDGASRYLRPRAVWLGLRLHEARVALRLFLRSDGAARYSLPFAPGPRPAAGISTKTDPRARVRDGAMGAVSFRRP